MSEELAFRFLGDLQTGARITETALELPEKLTAKQWEEIGRGLGKLDTATQWWIGDWWAFGEKWEYGERKELIQSEDWTGPAYQTCNVAAITCRAFKSIRRRINLSFSHHVEVAAIKDEALRESLLDWCEVPLKNGRKKPRSIRELQNEIVVRHNNHFFECACKELDEVLSAYRDRDPEKLKEVKGAIVLALTGLVRQRNQEKISLTESELQRLIVETAESMLGSLRGNVKMLTEFIGPIRRLAERTDFDFEEMIKAEPLELIERDLGYCHTTTVMIETFINNLKNRLTDK